MDVLILCTRSNEPKPRPAEHLRRRGAEVKVEVEVRRQWGTSWRHYIFHVGRAEELGGILNNRCRGMTASAGT
jgi:hypothetical protein